MDQGYQQIQQGNHLHAMIWKNEILFSWRWWLVVSLSVVPWVIAYLFTAPEKRKQHFTSSLIAIVIATELDLAGFSYDLWRYYVTVLPIMGGFLPWNFSLIPVGFVLTFETFPKWPLFLKGLVVSCVYAFVGEPLTDALGLTNHLHWKSIYSVPIYLLIYLASYYGGRMLCTRNDAIRVGSESNMVEEVENRKDKYRYLFEHSFDSVYFIEKEQWEKDFRFSEINQAFCEEMGYSREELMKLDPREVSDQESYNVDIKYRPLLKMGSMKLDTTFVTKSGEKKFVRLFVKVFMRREKIEILTIAKFLEQQVVKDQVT